MNSAQHHRPTARTPDAYVYDPADPMVTCGGRLVMSTEFTAGPADQRVTGEPSRTANTMRTARPSAVILPVIPRPL